MGLGIRNLCRADAVAVSNEFIDRWMSNANGEYVKVYLFLLRHEGEDITVSGIADALNHTEADVRRALTYWNKNRVLGEEPFEDSGQSYESSFQYEYAQGCRQDRPGFTSDPGQDLRNQQMRTESAQAGSGQPDPVRQEMAQPAGMDTDALRSYVMQSAVAQSDALQSAVASLSAQQPVMAPSAAGQTAVTPSSAQQSAAAQSALGQSAAVPSPRQQGGAAREARPVYSPEQVNRLSADEDFSQLLYIAQKYMNKVFTQRDCEVFAYLYDGLHMTAELLEYVVEYCVQGGHSNIRYIETVALNWHESGINTVEMAKTQSASYTKETFAVMKAFGLNDRKPGESERETIDRWFKSYGFTKELILEACDRTLKATHNPSFAYADKILSQWKKAGVKSMADVQVLDQKRLGGKTAAAGDQKPKAARPKGQFHNIPQRDTDYDAMILKQLREQ